MDRGSAITSHVGIETMARLSVWVRPVTADLGCTAWLGGSALRGKGWRDLDLYLVFAAKWWDDDAYKKLFGGNAWWHMAAAYSHYASAVVGANVEVHWMFEPNFTKTVPEHQRFAL